MLGRAVGEGPEVDAVGASWLGVAEGGTGEDHSLGTATDCRAIAVTEGGELGSAEATVEGDALDACKEAGSWEEHETVAAARTKQKDTRKKRTATPSEGWTRDSLAVWRLGAQVPI